MSSFFALDASTVHHDLLYGWVKIPQNHELHRAKTASLDVDGIGTIALLAPGHGTQLRLPLDRFDSFSEHAIRTLQSWRGPEGLRHWAALLRMFSELGARTGEVVWTLDEHLDRLGYDPRQRRDPALHRRVSQIVGFFLSIEVAIYRKDGTERERSPVFLTLKTVETDASRIWSDPIRRTVTLSINPLLYSGVRNPKTQELGSNWTPAPSGLSEIDHVRNPYAVGLALILLIRLRWRQGEGADYLDVTGRQLLDLAQIKLNEDWAKRTWNALDRTLATLVKVGAIDGWEWTSHPSTLAGTCRIRRAAPAVTGEMMFRPARTRLDWTGADLARWRTEHGWTQRRAAELVGVDHRSIGRAEASTNDAIGARLRRAILVYLESGAAA